MGGTFAFRGARLARNCCTNGEAESHNRIFLITSINFKQSQNVTTNVIRPERLRTDGAETGILQAHLKLFCRKLLTFSSQYSALTWTQLYKEVQWLVIWMFMNHFVSEILMSHIEWKMFYIMETCLTCIRIDVELCDPSTGATFQWVLTLKLVIVVPVRMNWGEDERF